MLSSLVADFRIIFERDPAARNWLEVIVCYPGLQALSLHRIAHWLYKVGIPYSPRGANWQRSIYRSWDGGCNWRNSNYR